MRYIKAVAYGRGNITEYETPVFPGEDTDQVKREAVDTLHAVTGAHHTYCGREVLRVSL